MIRPLFPSYIQQGRLPGAARLNGLLRHEIRVLSETDQEGRRWSKKNYVGGYSSYNSLTRLHKMSPDFGQLEKLLRPALRAFIRKLEWDLMGRKIEMTTCWANSMGKGTHHTMHLHPHSVISGVYFVDAPSGSSPFKLEDPRMARLMAAPPRRSSCRLENRNYVEFPPTPGQFLLFESWMKHEVPPHRGTRPRLSISFNYEWV